MKWIVAAGIVPALVATVTAAVTAQTGDDITTLDGIMKAYYEVISGPAGTSPDRARDAALHHANALVAIALIGENGKPELSTMTLDGYHDRFGAPRQQGFYEWEIHRITERFGNVVHVWSTYAASDVPNGQPHSRGINSIQLFHDGERWWITSWIFDSERASNPIPVTYLPK